MKNEKFCFSKGTGLIALIGIVLVGVVLAMQMVGSKSTSTSTRASASQARSVVLMNCNTTIDPTTKANYALNKVYYVDYSSQPNRHYKGQKVDPNGRVVWSAGSSTALQIGVSEITIGIGNYCSDKSIVNGKSVGIAESCNDISYEAGGCTQGLYQKGAYDAAGPFYANSSCLGKILKSDESGQVATLSDLQGANGVFYCGDNTHAKSTANGAAYRLKVAMEFACPNYKGTGNDDNGLVIFYYQNGRYYSDSRLNLESDVTDMGVGNFCNKIARPAKNSGTLGAGATQVSCGTLGGSAAKYVSKIGAQYYYDIEAIYEADDTNIKLYCADSGDVTSFTAQSNTYSKIVCSRFVAGGDDTVNLFFKGGAYFHDVLGQKEVSPSYVTNVCTNTPKTYKCGTYGTFSAAPTKKNQPVVTFDGVSFTVNGAEGFDSAKLQAYCTAN